jgi:aquaporin TIP
MENHWRPALGELIGTFALVFVGAGSVCTSQLTFASGPPEQHLLTVALASGLMYTVLLPLTVGVSGGFLNPAITIALWVFRRIELPRACWLIGAQFIGALLAALCLRQMFLDNVLLEAHFGTPHLNMLAFGGAAGATPSIKMLVSGIAIEFILTFILTFAIYGTLLDPRAPQLGVLGPGIGLTAIILMGYPLTGAAVNPARWLGPALWELTLLPGAFRDHAIYWIGPIFGALAAAGIYEYVLWPREETTSAEAPAESGAVTATLFKKK